MRRRVDADHKHQLPAGTGVSRIAILCLCLFVLLLVACGGYFYQRAGSSGEAGERAIGTVPSSDDVFRPVGPACGDGHFVSRFEYKGGVAIMRSECVHDAR